MVRLVLAVVVGGLLSACSSLYLHDDTVEQSTASARAGLDKAKIDDVFTRESAYLDQLQTEELKTISDRDAAQRDRLLLLFLEGNEGTDGLSLMKGDIDQRLSVLYNDSDLDPQHPIWRRMESDTWKSDIVAQINARYQGDVADYKQAKGVRPTDCPSVLAGTSTKVDNADAATQYDFVKGDCDRLNQLDSAQAERNAANLPEVPSQGGSQNQPLVDQIGALLSSNYRNAQSELKDLSDSLAQSKADADKLKKDLDARDVALKKSLDIGKPTAQGLTDEIKKLHDSLSEALSQVKDFADNPFAKKVAAEQLIASFQALIDATGPAAAAAPATGSATTGATGATASADGSVPDPAVIRASIAFVEAAAGIGDAFSNPPRVPHPNALAIGRAQMSYARDIADSEIADLESQVDAARARVNAIATDVYMLSRAKTELNELGPVSLTKGQGMSDYLAGKNLSHNAARHATAALFFYASSWNRGQILADLIQTQTIVASRRATLQRSRRAAQEWVDTIRPGLDTLVAYGKGGIDPKTIAQILGDLGLVATGVGVNQ